MKSIKFCCCFLLTIFSTNLIGQEIAINVSKIDDISCFSSFPCDASASVSIEWGTNPVTNYDILWSSNESSDTSVFLCDGWQYVSISILDEVYYDSVLIFRPSPLSIEVDVKNENCFGYSDASISIKNISGGVSPYTVEWSDGSDLLSLNDLSEGIHSVVVLDSNNCVFSSSFDVISAFDIGLSFDESGAMLPKCHLDSTGIISVFANPFVAIEKYEWVPNVSQSNFAFNITGGSYKVLATDNNGCVDSITINVPQPEPLELDFGFDSPICFEALSRLELNKVESDLDYFLNLSQFTDTTLFVEAGEYILGVSDQNGCTKEESFQIENYSLSEIDGPAEIVLVQNFMEDVTYEFISEYDIDSIYWTGLDLGIECNNCLNQTLTGVNDENYLITVIDINGCKIEKSIQVKIDKGGGIFYPNVFSPNQDGVNDVFTVYFQYPLIGIKSFFVFDRFGNKVCSEPDTVYDNHFDWKGTFQNQRLESGTYTFMLQLINGDGSIINKIGSVHIIY